MNAREGDDDCHTSPDVLQRVGQSSRRDNEGHDQACAGAANAILA